MQPGLLAAAAIVRAAASEYVQERETALAKLSPIHVYWRRLVGKNSYG